MQITEQELAKRRAHLAKTSTVAGPDDPIYSSGLTVNSFLGSTESMNASLKSTAGVSQPGSPAQKMPRQLYDLQNLPEDPVLGAVRANEAARLRTRYVK
jgi:hypothetical protein